MILGYNKEVLGKEILYCGQLIGPSFVQWEIFRDEPPIRSYGCFNPRVEKPVMLFSIDGYTEDDTTIKPEPKYMPCESVYLLSEAIRYPHTTSSHIITSTLVLVNASGNIRYSYFIKSFGTMFFAEELITKDVLKVMRELENAKNSK